MMTRTAHPRRHGALAMTWLLAASLSPAAMAFAQTAQPPAPNSAAPVSAAAGASCAAGSGSRCAGCSSGVAATRPVSGAAAAGRAAGFHLRIRPLVGQYACQRQRRRGGDPRCAQARGGSHQGGRDRADPHTGRPLYRSPPALCACAQRRPRLPLGGGECLPRQGLSGRQPCQRAIIAKLPARGLDVRPRTRGGPMSAGNRRPDGRLPLI